APAIVVDTAHVAPSQCSMTPLPAAHALVGDSAATAVSFKGLPAGAATTDQADPFQCSMRAPPPKYGLISPTAQMSLEEEPDTAVSRTASVRFGAGTVAHDVPSQCSINALPSLPVSPTAQMSLADSAVIPKSSPAPTSVETADHPVPSHRSISGGTSPWSSGLSL